MPELEDHSVDTGSLFAEAIREHLDLKARNAELDGDMPLDRYLNGDPLDNHPLFKSEEQARIEETLEGEVPAVEAQLGAPLVDMSREDKQRAVRLLDDRGAFQLRKAVEEVADALGVSRFTVYNYLNAGAR